MKRFFIAFAYLAALSSHATTLIFNVNGHTMTGLPGNQSIHKQFEALAFDQGKVIWTGKSAIGLEQFPDAAKIDGEGKTLIPSIIDAHGHMVNLGQSMLNVDLRGIQSESDALKIVRTYLKANPNQSIIKGRGWNQELWRNNQFPTKKSLDSLKIDKPIVLSRVDGHSIWVNSVALKLAGINKNTMNPPGGQIIKDSEGNPTGVLIDTAEKLVLDKLPPVSELDINYALDKAIDHLLSLGITSAHDAGVDQATLSVYLDRVKHNALGMRIYAMLSATDPHLNQWLKAGHISDPLDRLSVRSVKLYSDGALGSRGAALMSPYSDSKDIKGLFVTQPKELSDLINRVIQSGFQANVHAIGDYGNRLVLDAIEKSQKSFPKNAKRHRIEHAQVVDLNDIPRFKTLNIIASMQPTHSTSDMNMAESRLGSQRIKGAYAWRAFLNQNTIIASGSDFPVELANPFHGIHAAVTRQNHKNQPEGGWKPHDRMSVIEAFRTFTLDASYSAFQENQLGSLEKGKWADFIFIDTDIFTANPEQLWKVNVLQTWIAGEKVFQKSL